MNLRYSLHFGKKVLKEGGLLSDTYNFSIGQAIYCYATSNCIEQLLQLPMVANSADQQSLNQARQKNQEILYKMMTAASTSLPIKTY